MQNTATSNGEGDRSVFNVGALARTLEDTLGLRHPPVALAVCEKAPDDVAPFSGAVPSACTLWRRAETEVFFAPAAAHLNCPIGAMTMGFPLSEEVRGRLMDTVGTMAAHGYFDPAEAANIPTVPGAKSGIVYGPLAAFPLVPDVALVWVSGEGGMLLAEAAETVQWAPDAAGEPALGRPSCAAVALAIRQGSPTLSLGCAGMRVFTEIDADLNLAVLPRAALGGLDQRLHATARANIGMAAYYRQQKERFAPAVT